MQAGTFSCGKLNMASAGPARRRLPSNSPGRTGCLYGTTAAFRCGCTQVEHAHRHRHKLSPATGWGIPLIGRVSSGVWPPFGRYWQFPLKNSQPCRKSSCAGRAADLMKMSLNNSLNSFKKWWGWLKALWSPWGAFAGYGNTDIHLCKSCILIFLSYV